VPEFRYRKPIIEAALPLSGYACGKRLYELLSQSYYWEGMLADCEEVSKSS
jgi:hypothetical protein